VNAKQLTELIGAEFYTGVPDSQLRALCDYLMDTYGIDSKHHVIASNEGNCAALAAGYHLATGKTPVVYMQNSGQGNMINPAASLLGDKVYAIPIIYIIGWRGEPGTQDEPQHIYQGEITIKLLELLGIKACVISCDTTEKEILSAMKEFRPLLAAGKSVAFVVRKNGISYDKTITYNNHHRMNREEVLRHITAVSKGDPVISTTGKISRELFEIRMENGQGHECDFLTVGSMGHSSSIALGVAFNMPNAKIWCIDGDGAVLMHMGAMAMIGSNAPRNLIHLIINNEAHESVGGMPTIAGKINLTAIAKACNYPNAVCVDNYADLDKELKLARQRDELSMIEILCAIGSRKNLGRPTTTALDNKQLFMKYLASLSDSSSLG